MKTCFQIFKVGINELLAFLTTTEHESELIELMLQRQESFGECERQLLNKIASAKTDRKRYIYTVAIVALYGILERYIDAIIEAFVNRVASLVNSYEKMPEVIKKNHVLMSLDLVKAIIAEERYRKNLTPADVIGNLHSCLSGAPTFRINGSAFVLHRGNISLDKITGFLTIVGVDAHLRRVTLTPDILDFFQQREPERDIRKVADQDLMAMLHPINDLVERRNQVSHGVIDDIESVELLKERCCFVDAYGSALYNIMLQDVLKYQINHTDVQSLGKPIAVYNNAIACFEKSNCKIAVGDIIVAATHKVIEPFRYSPIISLEIDHQQHNEIVASQPTKFGVKVLFKASKDHDYYVIPNEAI